MSSVLEELRTLEQRLVSRLRELQPLVDEYNELLRLADRLGVDVAGAAPPSTKPRARATSRRGASRRNSSRSRPGGTRATGRERREQLLKMIREQPGVTVPELSKSLGVEPPAVYRVIRRLQQEGEVKKEGKALQLR